MNKKLVVAGILATLLPSAALAQPPDPNCVRSNQASTAEGTILGAGAGALLGSVLAGRHSRGTGAALGAVGGAVAGGTIANGRNDPCPPGYDYGPPPGGPGYGPGGPGPAGFWQGAPTGIHQRMDFMQTRIQRAIDTGRLNPQEARRAWGELRSIRAWEGQRRGQNGGGLSPDDRGYIQSRLDHLGASIHWMERTGY
ncbi:glycine zipper 2TM domain-containing protein [Caulobacter sp. S45]|uniref:glycine zipper 2TM domain-containing protein n=1 Tax=Caulobacter sp. S45 TaxID=1641861 RepID=UPI001C2070D4|nr:glycine zipper 2TM domain-containing protein [Caulobacter sp. S45]